MPADKVTITTIDGGYIVQPYSRSETGFVAAQVYSAEANMNAVLADLFALDTPSAKPPRTKKPKVSVTINEEAETVTLQTEDVAEMFLDKLLGPAVGSE